MCVESKGIKIMVMLTVNLGNDPPIEKQKISASPSPPIYQKCLWAWVSQQGTGTITKAWHVLDTQIEIGLENEAHIHATQAMQLFQLQPAHNILLDVFHIIMYLSPAARFGTLSPHRWLQSPWVLRLHLLISNSKVSCDENPNLTENTLSSTL